MLRTLIVFCAAMSAAVLHAQDLSSLNLPKLTTGKVAAENALWVETPKDRQFTHTKRVIVADIKGPGIITMMHFALPEKQIAKPDYRLGRELLLKIYWDGEASPSVDCPLVDFFCDPAGTRDVLTTALVNKRRGFNAYFPMPFAKSARVEFIYDGPVEPGHELWSMMPCYSYVMWRQTNATAADDGYFHATWRQEQLPLGERPYVAMDAHGKGKFIGWNVTVRMPGRPGYPVDENEDFYVDGEAEPSVQFQGLEDSFGFSWGFPQTENTFPMTGYFPFKEGAAAYRFFISDAITFEKSLKVQIAFGKGETGFINEFKTPANALEFSSVCYWYQREPHAALAEMPPAKDREPTVATWKKYENIESPEALRARGVALQVQCGRPEAETVFAESGFSASIEQGHIFTGWPMPVFHCRSDTSELRINLAVPKGAAGTVRLYMIDPDRFGGGRQQEIQVGTHSLGKLKDFEKGRWLECPITAKETADGQVQIRITNKQTGSNAVVSIIEWQQPRP